MTYQFIVAAPLLIAAILMAVRFVGCTQDFDQFEGPSSPSSYSDTVSSTDGLVSFWQLNDESPTTAVDSKDGNNGTYEAGVTNHLPGLVSANAFEPFNFATGFDGKTGYVQVPFAANLNPPKAFSVEALVKPSNVDTQDHVIVSSGGAYRLVLNGGSFGASVTAGTAGVGPTVWVSPGAQGPYYVAMTYDGTTLSLYVNPAATGDQADFQSDHPESFNSAQTGYQAATSGDLRIGASLDGGTLDGFFSGLIQDVAVYDQALDFKDIVAHYWVFATGYPGPEG
jgi:Concanavalin A-like lectin/glucanases superfamily